MPGEGTQKLTLDVEAKGAEKAAGQVGKVTGATEELHGKTKLSTSETVKAAEAQETLNAAESDYIGLLSQIDPVLGRVADASLKAGKIAGDFATTEIDLGSVVQTVTAAIAAQANTFKLLGAVGGVAIGVVAIGKALSFVRAESEKLRAELDALKARSTEKGEERLAAVEAVVGASQRRREGKFTAAEQAEAGRVYADVAQIGRVKDTELLQRNIAALVGILTGPEIEKLTLAGVEVDAEAPARTRERRARRDLRSEKTAEAFDREIERVREARKQQIKVGIEQLRSEDPLVGMEHFNEILKRFADGLDVEAVGDLVKRALELRKEYEKAAEAWRETGESMRNIPWQIVQGQGDVRSLLEVAQRQRAPLKTLYEDLAWGKFASTGGTPAEVDAARRIMEAHAAEQREATRELKEAASAMKDAASTLAAQPPVHIDQYHHARFVGPDAASQRRRIKNGENLWKKVG